MSRVMSRNRGVLGPNNSESSIPLMSRNANTSSIPGERDGESECRYTTSLAGMPELSSRNTSIPEQQTQLKTVVGEDTYLTPISCPPTYSESEYMHRRANAGAGNARNSETLKKESFHRSDSGLGDSESDHGSGGAPSLTSSILATSRLPTHQEEFYEEVEPYSDPTPHRAVPRAGNHNKQFNHSKSAPADLPLRNIPGTRQAENAYVDPNGVQEQHRSHAETDPGHGPSSGSSSHNYYTQVIEEQLPGSKIKRRARMMCCCQIFFIILCLLISMAALGLSIFILLSDPNAETGSSKTNVSEINEILSNLQKEVADLRKENKDLKANMTSQERRISQSENDFAELESAQSTMNDQLQEVNTMLHNINHNHSHAQVGPQQFPASMFNFSTCVSRHTTMAGPQTLANEPIVTTYLPTPEESKDYFVIFAYCSFENATGAVLNTTVTGTKTRFRCECWGRMPETDGQNSKCTINVWMCPS